MQSQSVIAAITEEIQNDVVAALHAAGVGHLTRVIRRERGTIAEQLKRAGVPVDSLPERLHEADRIVLVSPATYSLETASLVLQRGAVSAWTVSSEEGWEQIDDKAIEIAAARGLPPRPVPPPHRSGRTFRKPNIRRRPRRGVDVPPQKDESDDTSPSS